MTDLAPWVLAGVRGRIPFPWAWATWAVGRLLWEGWPWRAQHVSRVWPLLSQYMQWSQDPVPLPFWLPPCWLVFCVTTTKDSPSTWFGLEEIRSNWAITTSRVGRIGLARIWSRAKAKSVHYPIKASTIKNLSRCCSYSVTVSEKGIRTLN